MRILQRFTYISALIVSIIYFIFTLSFSTGWAIGQTLGDFYDEAQLANKVMFQWGLYLVIAAFLSVLFKSTVNRRFFISNYVLSAATVIFLIIAAILTISYMPDLRVMYEALDPDYMTIITAINLSEISTTIFDLGLFLSVVMIIQALLIVTVVVIKTTKQMLRARLKSAHERRITP